MLDLNSLRVGIISGTDLLSAMAAIVRLLLLWAGIIAFFYALYGGFMYLTAGGDGGKTTQGQKTITNAIIGIIIISLSYILVAYITERTRSSFKDTGAPASAPTAKSQVSPAAKKTNIKITPTPKTSTKATTVSPSPSSKPNEEGTVSGVVIVDGGRASASGIAVTIQGAAFVSTIGADSGGSFQFPVGPPAGTYTLSARSLDDTRPDVDCNTPSIDVQAGQETTAVITCTSQS